MNNEAMSEIRIKIHQTKYWTKYFFTEALPFWIARKLPRKIVYYAIIRAWAYSSVESYPSKHIDEITWSEVLKDAERF